MSASQVDVNAPADDQADEPLAAEKNPRALKLEIERARLLESLEAGNFSTLMARVAGVLNMFPDTRNSDVKLALEYWELFQPELFNDQGILPRNLFKLERMTNITRARAKIQNDFGLFQANEGIKRARKKNEETMQEAVVENSTPSPSIHIFADETGKHGSWLIVGAVWVLNPRSVYAVTRAIDIWKATSLWNKREIHFANFGARDIDPLREYLNVVAANREYLGFKFVAVERSGLQRSIEDALIKLHELMIVEGLKHETVTQRVVLPRRLSVTVDQENSLDKLALRAAKDRVNLALDRHFANDAIIDSFSAVSSRQSTLVQLADVISGAVNRRLNPQEIRGAKDEMADLVLNSLGIQISMSANSAFDAATMIYV